MLTNMDGIKDHYAILELPPSADLAAVKKAYRRLAQEFHPDKTNNDPYANARFRDIKEAYEVLSNPARKEKYLQQRWFQQSTGRKMNDTGPVTPATFMQQCLGLYRYVSGLDHYRVDRQGLSEKFETLLQEDDLNALKVFNETGISQEAFQILLRCLTPLRADDIVKLRPRLLKLADEEPAAVSRLDQLIQQHRNRERRDRLMPWILLLAAIAAIALIFQMAG